MLISLLEKMVNDNKLNFVSKNKSSIICPQDHCSIGTGSADRFGKVYLDRAGTRQIIQRELINLHGDPAPNPDHVCGDEAVHIPTWR